MAAETGVTIEQARRLWRALGFPEHGREVAFTAADVEAVSTLIGIVDERRRRLRHGGQPHPRASARPWPGSPTGRSRRWSAGSRSWSRARRPPARASARRCAWSSEVNPPFEQLLIYAWRRHLAAAVARIEAMGANDEDLHTIAGDRRLRRPRVSFTALSNQHRPQDRIGDLVEVFESRCADVVAGHGGRVIKSLGDSVLFVNTDPIRGVDTAEGIINVIGRDARMPDVRLGLASGRSSMRLGDVFGPPVNMAARLTAVARRNRLIIDADDRRPAAPRTEFETRRLPGPSGARLRARRAGRRTPSLTATVTDLQAFSTVTG